MALSEFEIIERIFRRGGNRSDVVLGIGDDAAVVRVRPEQCLAIATDTIVEGVHFPIGTDAADIGYRALAVNLSDLAAMGAEPTWANLALTLPAADQKWLQSFANGFFELADRHQVQLIGGDTTRGPLSISVTLHGWLEHAPGLRRNGARVGDEIIVSGTLGDAAAGLACIMNKEKFAATVAATLAMRFLRPNPRVELGRFLLSRAHSAIDVSDGFLADLSHILRQSGVGATVRTADIPISSVLSGSVPSAQALNHALNGGDDYELCFTLQPARWAEVDAWAKEHGITLTKVGCIEAHPGLRLIDADGKPVDHHISGYRHF